MCVKFTGKAKSVQEQGADWNTSAENCIMRRFIVCTVCHILFG